MEPYLTKKRKKKKKKTRVIRANSTGSTRKKKMIYHRRSTSIEGESLITKRPKERKRRRESRLGDWSTFYYPIYHEREHVFPCVRIYTQKTLRLHKNLINNAISPHARSDAQPLSTTGLVLHTSRIHPSSQKKPR